MMLFTAALTAVSCGEKEQKQTEFDYNVESFADIQILRYKVDGFDELSLKQKTFIYYLNEAALWGRDILFDQNGRYNLEIRRMLEDFYQNYKGDREDKNFKGVEEYLKRVWFSNGIHHHYGSDKFVPKFDRQWFVEQTKCSEEIAEVIFNPEVMPKKISLAEGVDLLLASACNYYQGVTQEEAEAFYAEMKAKGDQTHPVMYGMNSTLVKDKDGKKIFQLENLRHSKISTYNYFMNVNPGSVAASDMQMLIELVQQGVVGKHIFEYLPVQNSEIHFQYHFQRSFAFLNMNFAINSELGLSFLKSSSSFKSLWSR